MERVTGIVPVYRCRLDASVYTKFIPNILRDHSRFGYEVGNSFPIAQYLDDLYQSFFDVADREFGPFELSSRNIRTCWGYVTNKDFYKGGIHHHIRSSTLNAVFYLHVPETTTDREGSISFYDDARDEIFTYKPVTGDLLIFPNYLLHQPHQSFTDDFRISINMEIIAEGLRSDRSGSTPWVPSSWSPERTCTHERQPIEVPSYRVDSHPFSTP